MLKQQIKIIEEQIKENVKTIETYELEATKLKKENLALKRAIKSLEKVNSSITLGGGDLSETVALSVQ